MPLDPYMMSMEDLKKAVVAQELAADSCMRSLGFTDWEPGAVRSWDPESFKEYDYFEYLDPATVAVQGYPRPSADPELAVLNGPDPENGPSQEQMAAYEGYEQQTKTGRAIPEGGCFQEARRKIYGQSAGLVELPADARNLAVLARSSAMSDSRVRRALAEWKNCVTAEGLSYESPVVPPNDIAWVNRDPSVPASEEEKRVARIDAGCQKAANVVGVYKSVRIAYEKHLVASQQEKLTESRAILEKWKANAAALLKKNGG
ncbi:hypothetical protein [Streptosporangium sp. NPDC051022]|uniref:hypothetical protein n=1 Tax=Streptosporangium sp. NPDC051022 TaxID=3155752 RepID=UPI00341FFFD9